MPTQKPQVVAYEKAAPLIEPFSLVESFRCQFMSQELSLIRMEREIGDDVGSAAAD